MMRLRSSAGNCGFLAGFCDRKTITSSASERASPITHIWPLVMGSRVPENPIFFMLLAPYTGCSYCADNIGMALPRQCAQAKITQDQPVSTQKHLISWAAQETPDVRSSLPGVRIDRAPDVRHGVRRWP